MHAMLDDKLLFNIFFFGKKRNALLLKYVRTQSYYNPLQSYLYNNSGERELLFNVRWISSIGYKLLEHAMLDIYFIETVDVIGVKPYSLHNHLLNSNYLIILILHSFF